MSDIKAIGNLKQETDLTIALAGNPNVGKSTIFNRLSGSNVITANYPGKTVELNIATTHFDKSKIGLIDLPGTYAIGAVSEDQWVARRAVLDGKPDVVLFVVDATNLSRNLYMVAQFLDLGVPMVIALNLIDQAHHQGLDIDSSLLSKAFGLPVIETVASSGEGLDQLMATAVEIGRGRIIQKSHINYGNDIEEKIFDLSGQIETDWITDPTLTHNSYDLGSRALAVLLLENDPEFTKIFGSDPRGQAILETASLFRGQISDMHGEDAAIRIARERHGLVGTLALEAETVSDIGEDLVTRLWRFTTAAWSGIPLLLATLSIIFAVLFYVGNILATWFSSFWAAVASPPIQGLIKLIAGDSVLARVLGWGFDNGIEAALGVGIPYVMTFYLMLAVLEDSGYLNSIAFLADRLMHRFGLHGRAIIPIIAGAGCSVPAIIGTRTLTTLRERTIASSLIVLVPCSARTAVILGAVSRYIGAWPAIAIFGIVLLVVGGIGLGLNKIMPGTSTGLVMEMFPFRMPSLQTVLKRTWWRVREFIFVATPIVIVGSLLLGWLYESGYIWFLAKPLSPIVVQWLGLPLVSGLALIFAVLRKELALQLLVTLAIAEYGHNANNLLSFMSGKQLFVYALVNTLYIPCIATIAVLGRELGWLRAIYIMLFTVSFAVLLGGIVMRLLGLFW